MKTIASRIGLSIIAAITLLLVAGLLSGCASKPATCDKCPCKTSVQEVLSVQAVEDTDALIESRATRSERALLRAHLLTHAAHEPSAAPAVKAIMRHPVALRVLENKLHSMVTADPVLVQAIADFEAQAGQVTPPPVVPPAPKTHPLLTWLWTHKDQILAFVLQIIKLFGISPVVVP